MVKCRLCGKSLKFVNPSHLATHGYTYQEYIDEFELKRTEVISVETRYALSDHPEYEPLNDRKSMARKIREIYRTTGQISHQHCCDNYVWLYRQVLREFNNWDEFLIYSGFDPKKVRVHRVVEEEELISFIKDGLRKKLPLNSGAIYKSNSRFWFMANKLFGSWDAALSHAGIDPEKIRLAKRHPWTKKEVVAAIRDIFSDGYKTIDQARSMRKGIVQAATKLFGSWTEALDAARVPTNSRKNPNRKSESDWTTSKVRKDVVNALHQVKKLNQSKTAIDLNKIERVCYEARRAFGTRSKALLAADIKLEDLTGVWTKEKVLEMLSAYFDIDSQLEPSRLKELNPFLYRLAYVYCGSWGGILKSMKRHR